MPFRDRVRKAFGRSRSNSDNSDHSATGSKPVSPTTSNSKQPKAPKEPAADAAAPAYKRRLPEAHQARMAAFSWANNPCSRHMSDASQYSPKGSRVPTRENSRSSVRERKSMQSPRRRGPHLVENAESDDFVGTAAPPAQHSSDQKPRLHEHDPELEDPSKMVGNGGSYGDAHFTNDQLATAFKQSMMHAPNGMATGTAT